MIEGFEKHLKKTNKGNTVIAYLSRVNSILSYHKQCFDGITQKDVDMFFKRKELKQSTIQQSVHAFKAWNKYIGFDGELKTDRVNFNLEKQEELQDKPFCLQSIETYFSRLNPCIITTRTKTLAYLLFYTGVRISEAHQLRIQDINFKDKTIFIKSQKSKDRYIPLHNKLSEQIKEYINQRSPSCEYLFLNHGRNNKNEQMSYGGLRGVLKSLLKESGYPNQSTHVFRYTFISHMFKSGAYIKDIKSITGHTNYGDLEHYFIGDKTGADAVKLIK